MNKANKNALVIGGTGIIGNPLVLRLTRNGEYNVYSIGLEKASLPPFPDTVAQYTVDRNSLAYVELINRLNLEVDYWDAVIDLISYDEKSAEQTYALLKDETKHFITLSTTLVYDRSEDINSPISELTPLAKEGELGGYVDGKLRLEKFWNNISDANWTILRPYHVLGKHSLLGCIPEHNRDPKLVQEIQNGEVLRLCEGGNIPFNYVHVNDIAEVIYKVIGNKKTYRQVYNLVNPEVIIAKDYYAEIAHQLGVQLKVENVSKKVVWQEMKGWEMTTLPHVYDVEKLVSDVGFVPSTGFQEGIKDALVYYPKKEITIDEIQVHRNMNKFPRPKKPHWL